MEFTALPSQGAGPGHSSPDSKQDTAEGFEEALEKALADSGLSVGLPGFIQHDVEIPSTDLDLPRSETGETQRISSENESSSTRLEQVESESQDWKPLRSEKPAAGSEQAASPSQNGESSAGPGSTTAPLPQGAGMGNLAPASLRNPSSLEAPASMDAGKTQGSAATAKRAPAAAARELPDRILQIVTRMNEQGQKIHRAVMRLRPEKLGLMEVEIRLEDGRLSVRLAAQQAEAREILQGELERIRGVLSEQGFDEIAMHLESGRADEGGSEPSANSKVQEWKHEESELGEKPVRHWDGLIDLLA